MTVAVSRFVQFQPCKFCPTFTGVIGSSMAEKFKTLCEEVGLPQVAVSYLMEGRGLKCPAILTRMANSEEEFATKAWVPLKNKTPMKGTTYELEDCDDDVMEATFKYLWSKCKI